LDHKDHKVYKDQLGKKVKWEREDFKEIVAQLDQWDQKELKVFKEILDRKVFKDRREVQLVPEDQQV
jgi:hypothetical protein